MIFKILLLFLRALIAGGGAPEIELALRLNEYSRTLSGMDSYCVRAFGDALEVIPSTLAENAGLNPISTVTELRNRHAQGEKTAGINVRKVKKNRLFRGIMLDNKDMNKGIQILVPNNCVYIFWVRYLLGGFSLFLTSMVISVPFNNLYKSWYYDFSALHIISADLSIFMFKTSEKSRILKKLDCGNLNACYFECSIRNQ